MNAARALFARLRSRFGQAPGASAPAGGPPSVVQNATPTAVRNVRERPARIAQAARAAILAAFVLCLSLFMLAAKFPDERLRLWLERTLSPGHGLSLSVREARAALFPPGAVLSGLRLRLEGASEPLADMPEARLHLSLLAACLVRLEVSAVGRTLGGELTVAAVSDSLFGGGWQEVGVTVRGLDLARSPGLPWLLNRHAGGRVSGEVRFVPGKARAVTAGLLFEEAFVEVEGEMLRPVRVELGRMAVRAEVREGGLEVSECTVASDMLRGALTGRITPDGDIRASRLDFSGALADEVQAEVTTSRPAGMRLSGTLAGPVLTWEETTGSEASNGNPPADGEASPARPETP